jgi:sugar/nucleoside kinase (ribokinase family)
LAALKRVLCCGNITFDIPVWPVEDIEWNTTRWIEVIDESLGGNGANTSLALARLGVPVRLISLIGDDDRGRKLIEKLSEAGVDTSGIGTAAEVPTSSTVVLIEREGARKFYHRPGASRRVRPEQVRFDGEFSHFHFANPFALPEARGHCGEIMKGAREAGLTTSLDAGWDSLGRWMEDIGPALPWTDWLFVNDSEERMMGGSHALRNFGASHIVVKTGAAGCIVDGQPVSGFQVEAVDSTGAGDCFAGAFIAALLRGLTPLECGRVANAVGALNVTRIGATTGVLTWEETLAWMQVAKTA